MPESETTEKEFTALFIGGPMDGRRMDFQEKHPDLIVCTQPDGGLVHSVNDPMVPHRYCRMVDCYQELVYRHHSLSELDALQRLNSLTIISEPETTNA